MTCSRIAAVILVFGCVAATGACAQNPETAKREYVRGGDAYAAQKKYQEAVIQYRNALRADPVFGEARLKLAETYERLGEVANASEEYVRAADLFPGDAGVQVKAANFLLLARKFEDANARADKALAIAADNVDARMAKANALAGLKNLDAAVIQIQEAIRTRPDRSALYASLGALEQARGHRDQAEEAFKKATETDPKSVQARLSLANLYWSTGSLPAAEREMTAALAIDPRDISTNRSLAVFYLATNRPSDAEPKLKIVADQSRESTDRFMLADYYVSAGRFVEAKTLLHRMVSTDPASYSMATIRLSSIAVRGGDAAGALALIDEVLKKQPRNVDALVARTNLLLLDRKYDAALASGEAAVEADVRSAEAQYVLARVYSARQDWDHAFASYSEVLKLDSQVNAARLELARLSLLKGRPDDALRFAQEALTAQPGLPEASRIQARAMLAKGDVGRAEPHVLRLAKEFPGSASDQSQLGRLYALKGDSKSARDAFEHGLAIDSTNIEALSGLTALDVQAKNSAAARARVDARLAASPNDPQLLLLAAKLSMKLGDAPAAERSLRKVIEVDPARFEAYGLLGQFYASQGRLDEARAEFEKIAHVHPESAVGADTVVGVILQMQNRQVEAQAHYEKVLSIDPRAAVAANNLAWIYAEGGAHLDAALELAQTAKSQLTNSAEVSDTLGWVYYKKGLPGLAVPIFRQSVDKSPKNAVYEYHLGLAYAKNGDKEEARKALEQALTLDPRFDGSADARRVLAGLEG